MYQKLNKTIFIYYSKFMNKLRNNKLVKLRISTAVFNQSKNYVKKWFKLINLLKKIGYCSKIWEQYIFN